MTRRRTTAVPARPSLLAVVFMAWAVLIPAMPITSAYLGCYVLWAVDRYRRLCLARQRRVHRPCP